MLTYIPSIEALERFKAECKHEEANLLSGKCQLCIDALLFMTPIPVSSDSLTSSMRVVDEISANIKAPIILSGDEYLLDLIGHCPSVKIVCPSTIPFSGFVDLSSLESCISLELVRIPFARLTGIDNLRNRLRSLVWIRGYNEDEANDEPDLSIFTTFSFDSRNTLKNNLKVDELFWDQFGTWPLLNYLCISQSNISHINASTMPPSIKTLDLRMNRIYHFSNQANYSLVSTITKLCLDYNSLKELPKLNDNTCATLVHLSLRGNLIESVSGLRNFSKLDYLDLSDNSICDIRQLLNELMHLSKSLKTVYIENNPVSCGKSFPSQCQSVLYQLGQFNGRPVKRTVRKVHGDDPESALLPINVDVNLQASTSASNRYGTFLRSSVDMEESIRTDRSEFEDSFDRQPKGKALKERFVVINEHGNEEAEEEANYIQFMVPLAANSTSAQKGTIEITADLSKNSLSKKNYLFGGLSGSYSSFKQISPNETQVDAGTSVKSQHLTEEVIQAEKNKLLQKRMQLGDDWLTGSQEAALLERALLVGKQTPMANKDAPAAEDSEPTQSKTATDVGESQPESVSKKNDLDETCEWDVEDTEDEKTVFLVEIYPNESEFMRSLQDESSGDYFFLRVRPRDGLLFEKDCTTGKVLTTLDLKILEHFAWLPRDVDTANATALRFIFDTTIASKRERVYRFVEENQCESFADLYLGNYGQFKRQFEAELTTASLNASTSATSKQLSTTPLSRSGHYSWFYMCLRCGFRTNRIITDCTKCHSDLIIKDEGTNVSNGASTGDFQKTSTPIASSSPANGSDGCLEANEQTFTTANESQGMSSTVKDNTSLLSDENMDSEPSLIDENYFKANIDHTLKLLIEIYIYEQIGDTQLKSESIESLCHCMAYNFTLKHFAPALVVLTANYLFVFAHLLNKGKAADEGGEVLLRFYRALAGPRASQFIISHLPGHLKNQGYWIECAPGTDANKKGDKKKKRKRSKLKLPEYALELLLFDDRHIGKAFLELFLHSHRTCFRSQQLVEQGESNLVLIKADLTELTHVDEDASLVAEMAPLGKRKLTLSFDDACEKLLEEDSRVHNTSPYSSSPPFTETVHFFLVRSFNLITNLGRGFCNGSTNGRAKTSKDGGPFKVEENLVFIVSKASLIICQLRGHFSAITPLITNQRSNKSLACALQSCTNFDDRIEFFLLIKDLITNLLPNIYIDKQQLTLVLRFRDEDNEANATRSPTGPSPSGHPKIRSGLIVYDYQIEFVNVSTLMRASKLIQFFWEEAFGVTLTLSRHMPT